MLHNPSGLYSLGNVKLDPKPYIDIALKARAMKQAREQAIDQYYQKLPDTINDKGVRDQEIPIINAAKDKIFEYGMQNREALRNPKIDNGAARYNLEKMMRDVQGVARQSQNAGRIDLEVGKMRLQQGNQWINDDDEFIAANELHNLPVTDPRHKTIDVGSLLSNKPFDDVAFGKEVASRFKYGDDTPIVTPHPTDKTLEIVITPPKLNDETKQGIYNFAANKLHGNRAFRKKIEESLSGTGQLDKLNELHQKIFGKPIESDEDIAAAFTVSQLPVKQTTQKTREDLTAKREANMADKKEMENLRDKHIRGRMYLRKELGLDEPSVSNDVSFDETGADRDVPVIEFKTFAGIPMPRPAGKISNGIVYDESGAVKKDGEITIKVSDLPANTVAAMRAAKVFDKFLPADVKAVIKNGEIQTLKTKNGDVSREAILNFQKKLDTERKGENMNFGNKNKPAVKQKKGELDDL